MNDLRDAPERTPAAAATAAARPAPAAPAARPGYAAQLLRGARVAPQGLLHLADGVERRLAWDEIWFAVAAEVGEPEGVRAIVFDLVVGRDVHGFLALRLDAEPGPFAEEVARAIHAFVPRGRWGPSIKSLAHDGVASHWYPDLESFEEAVASAVARSRA